MRYLVLALIAFSLLIGVSHADQKVQLKRKAGLWEVSASSDGHPIPMNMKQCADEATDAEMMQMSEIQSEGCKVSDFSKTEAGYEFVSECQVAHSKVVSKAVFSGDFNAEYKGEITTTMSPPLFGKGKSTSSISAKWIGSCPANMKPGDMLTGEGIVIGREQAKHGAKMAAEMMKSPEMLKAMKDAMAGVEGMEEALKQLQSQ